MVRRLAIIPARGGSKRISNKNIRDFCGKPMIAHILQVARESELFDVIHVSTESLPIRETVENLGCRVEFMRTPELADDHTPIMPVLKYVTETYASRGQLFDQVWLLMACAPLVESTDLQQAAQLFDQSGGTSPVLAISEYPVPIEWAFSRASDGKMTPVRLGMFAVRSQDLEKNISMPEYSLPFRPLMFKVLILQSLYNLADAQTEFQIRDRFTFLRFLGLTPESRIPDEKTIWAFRESVKARGLYDELFQTFTAFLEARGFEAKRGTVIDARIVEVPKQRNTRSGNATIKEGLMPAGWEKSKPKKAQKDIEARWTQKNGKNYYGYKNHIAIDAKHKFIRRYEVSTANVHDSQCFERLLDRKNSDPAVYADSAYRSEDHERLLKRKGFKNRVHHRVWTNQTLSERERRENRARSRIRARVEHVFGHQVKAMRQSVVRGIGLARIRTRIALTNLAYNMSRLAHLRPQCV